MRPFLVATAVAVAVPLSATAATFSFDTYVLRGDPAPGTDGATFDGFSSPNLNAAGDIAFEARLRGGDVVSLTNNRAIFSSSAGLVARRGDVAPGTDGATFSSFSGNPGAPLSQSSTGEVAFGANLADGDTIPGINNTGFFTSSGLAVRSGDVAPGTGGAQFTGFSNALPGVNAAGDIAFVAGLRDPDTNTFLGQGAFTSSGLVARTGDPAPGTGGASFDGFINYVALNDAGETAFWATLAGDDVTFENNGGIFTSSGLVARAGDIAPGTDGARFNTFEPPA